LESVLNQVLQAQAAEQLSAEPYERTDERQGYRNGTDPHLLITRVGTITKFRKSRRNCAEPEFPKSTVSDLCKRLDPIVTAWNNRKLRERFYLFLIVDALVLKVREEGRVRSRGVMLAYGVKRKATEKSLD
jgi:putative transposase